MSLSLKVNNLYKSYKKQKILEGISFQINKNEIIGLIGNNGAGKTTLMKCILQLTNIDSGEILINNINIKKKLCFKNVGSVIETPKLYGYMTGYENLYAQSLLYNHISKDHIISLSKELGIYNSLNKKVKNYSLGMKQRLSIAQALLNNPILLILDEPMNGLDPQGIYKLKQYLKKISRNTSILISSHILSHIDYLCDTVLMLKNGKIVNLDLNKHNKKSTIFETSNSKKSMEILNNFNKNSKYINSHKIAVELNKEEIPIFIKKLVNNNEELLNANIQYKRQIGSTDNLSDNLRNIFNDNIKLNSYYINNNINPKEMNLWKFLDESSILTLIIIIYGIITSSSNLPREINNGTLGLLVTKHYKRKEIFFRKIIKFCTFKFNAIYLFVYNHIYNWYSIMGNRWY
ncbi:ABC transporter ATP-binding protein [Dethiothermospora halolimnae]|uniref:ABC transporter ATP-binding protein n=1 Tax=Dethiothermospora halolimnae TaxID=3114390 RepID=UPI003CCBE08C